MADVKWIKIVTDIFEDDKILVIESMPKADAILVIWFKLLCLAGKQNNAGKFYINGSIPYTDELFASSFRRPTATVRQALKTFERLGMIEIVDGAVTIPKWGKYQSTDKISKRNDQMRTYMRDYRSRKGRARPVADDAEGAAPDADALEASAAGENADVSANVSANAVRKTGANKSASKHDVSATEEEREGEEEGEGDTTCGGGTPNPFGAAAGAGDTAGDAEMGLEAYAASNLMHLSPRNAEELLSFRDALPEALIRHAIDEACAAGVRRYNYVRSILNRYVDEGYTCVADALAHDAQRRQSQKGKADGSYDYSDDENPYKGW